MDNAIKDLQTIMFIAGLIQFFLLCAFIALVADVSALRTRFLSRNPSYWMSQYNKSIALHRPDQALRALEEFIWYKQNGQLKGKAYAKLKVEYESRFNELGGKFPKEMI
ncbi:hypothetical protein [Mucilaginibacter sp.]